MTYRDDHKCFHCGCDFADHNYVPDSISRWMCPHPKQETTYGYFHGGDPRSFHPDGECCSETEIARWKEACAKAEELEACRSLPCPSGFQRMGDATVHVTRAPFGIGTYVTEYPSEFEPADWDERDDDYSA